MPKAPASQGRIHRLNMRLLSLLLIAALMLSVLIAVPVLNSSAEQDMATKSAEWVDKENGIAKITLGVNDPTTSGSGSTTATTKPTEATTTTTTSSSTVGSKLLIDWDKQNNYYCRGTAVSKNDSGIHMTHTGDADPLINTWNNAYEDYTKVKFTVTANSGNVATRFQVKCGSEISQVYTLTSGVNSFDLALSDFGITSGTTGDFNIILKGGAIDIVVSDIVVYKEGNSDTSTTKATTTTTTTTTSSSTVDSTLLIDWDVNSNYYAEGSTLTKGTNCITATKSSGANLITSNNNNIAAYDGLKFTVTPNSANQKTALVVKVNDVQKNFTLGSGTTECVLSFAEIGVTPTSSSTIFFGAEGDGAADLTISDVYAYTGDAGDSTTAATTTTTTTVAATTTTTIAQTTTTTSSSTVDSKLLIDWDKQDNYYCGGTAVSKNDSGIHMTHTGNADPLINSWNNAYGDYTKVKFTVTANSGNAATRFQVKCGSEISQVYTLTSGVNSFDLALSDFGITSGTIGDFNIILKGGAIDVVISDITVYTADTLDIDVRMEYGAAIRLNEKTGIRFYTSIDTDMIAQLKADGRTVTMGTIIAPADLISGEFTHEDANVDVVFDSDEYYTEDGFVGIVGSIVDIEESHYGREYIGRGYICVDGVYYYASLDNNVRSLKYVANALKADTAVYERLTTETKKLVDTWSQAPDYQA